MMPGRPVRVAVIFEPGKQARPVWFERGRRQHMISQTTYCWRGEAGGHDLVHYAVTDGEDLYELVYDPTDQAWSLYEQQAR